MKVPSKRKKPSIQATIKLTDYEQKTAIYLELMQTRASLLTLNEVATVLRVNTLEDTGLGRLQEIKANVDARRVARKGK